jgi:hypothetical protein
VEQFVPKEWEEYPLMMNIANGVNFIKKNGYIPAPAPSKLRSKYERVAPAVNKLVYESWLEDKIIILPTCLIPDIPDLDLSGSTSWAIKFGKDQGRLIADSSVMIDGIKQKNIELRDAAELKWGPIVHPKIKDLVNMILQQAAITGWDSLILWKMDLRGAFTLVDLSGQGAL